MRLPLLLLVILISLALPSFGQDKLEWSESRKLTVNDFKGPAPDPSTKQSLILNIGLETNFKKEEIEKLTTLNSCVTNLFSPNKSWIDWTDKARLRYAITLFDLNEWMVRELRKRLNENREQVLAGQYQSILEGVQKEFQKIHEAYESESNHGDYAIGQMNWETRINERIISLAEYCKKCGAGKN